MPLEVTYDVGNGAGLSPVQSFGVDRLKLVSGKISFDDSYPAGGEALDLSEVFPQVLSGIAFESNGGYLLAYDHATKKVKVYAQSAASAGTPAGTVALGTPTNGISGQAGQAITANATPGGNKVYLKYTADGRPYLCSNLATAGASVWLDLYTGVKLLLVHDADAATGGLEVKIDVAATQPNKLQCNNTVTGVDAEIPTTDPRYFLIVNHVAEGGVSLYYDDGVEGDGLVANIAAEDSLGLAKHGYTFTGSPLASHQHAAEVSAGTNLAALTDVRWFAWGH